MSRWPSTKARRLWSALLRAGWTHVRTVGSHKMLRKEGYADFPFSFHDKEEIGPRMLAKIAKDTGLAPDDL